MTGDIDLNYSKILKLLIDNAPKGASKISFDYEVKVENDSSEGGVSYYYFWLHNENGEKSTYSVERPIAGYQLGEECLEIRRIMARNSGNKWKKALVEIDFKEDKFHINYEY